MNLSDTAFVERFNQNLLEAQEKDLKSLGMFDLQAQPMTNAKLYTSNLFPHVQKIRIEGLKNKEITSQNIKTTQRFAIRDVIQNAFSALDSIASPEQIPFITKEYLDAMVEKMGEDCIVLFCGNSGSKIFGYQAYFMSMDFEIDNQMYHRPIVKNPLPSPSLNNNRIYVIKKDLFKLFVHPAELNVEKRIVNEIEEIISDLQLTFELSLKGVDYVGDRFIPKNPKERLFISCEFPKYRDLSL